MNKMILQSFEDIWTVFEYIFCYIFEYDLLILINKLTFFIINAQLFHEHCRQKYKRYDPHWPSSGLHQRRLQSCSMWAYPSTFLQLILPQLCLDDLGQHLSNLRSGLHHSAPIKIKKDAAKVNYFLTLVYQNNYQNFW